MITALDSDRSARRVLVTDPNLRAALAVVRSLGAQGCEVLTTGDGLAARSRHATAKVDFPDPGEAPGAWREHLIRTVRSHDIGTVYPIGEMACQQVLRVAPDLWPARLTLPEGNAFQDACDKLTLAERARALGIAAPPTRRLAAGTTQADGCEDWGWPLILKPRRSWVPDGDGWFATGVRVAADPTEFRDAVQGDRSFQIEEFGVQPFIPGHGAGVFVAARDGEILATFAHRRMREKPPRGGVSVLSESVAPDPRAQVAAETLLADLRWSGIAMVEFRMDETGTPWLMEISPRPWGSIQLAIDAGIDFPWIAWCIANDHDVAEQSYDPGNRLRWVLGDLDHLIIRLKERRGGMDALRAVGTFLRPTGDCRHEVDRWGDLAPALYEAREWLADVLGLDRTP